MPEMELKNSSIGRFGLLDLDRYTTKAAKHTIWEYLNLDFSKIMADYKS